MRDQYHYSTKTRTIPSISHKSAHGQCPVTVDNAHRYITRGVQKTIQTAVMRSSLYIYACTYFFILLITLSKKKINCKIKKHHM